MVEVYGDSLVRHINAIWNLFMQSTSFIHFILAIPEATYNRIPPIQAIGTCSRQKARKIASISLKANLAIPAKGETAPSLKHITWHFGSPSSSSHALIGSLCGAAVACANGDWQAIIWLKDTAKDAAGDVAPLSFFESSGVLPKVIASMFFAPLTGLLIAYGLIGFLYALLRIPVLLPIVFGAALSYGLTFIIHTATDWPPADHLAVKFGIAALIVTLLYWHQARLSQTGGLTTGHITTPSFAGIS